MSLLSWTITILKELRGLYDRQEAPVSTHGQGSGWSPSAVDAYMAFAGFWGAAGGGLCLVEPCWVPTDINFIHSIIALHYWSGNACERF